MGKRPLIIAKIERAGALEHFDEILKAADGIMLARGDLGVEVPIEEIAIVQKRMITKANVMGKPVITATQMLESMVSSRLPTRAESTDVANAILDGTDCVMLSAESAIGQYPEESVAMLARIAATTESHRPHHSGAWKATLEQKPTSAAEAIAVVVQQALDTVPCAAIFVPTLLGGTARMISRFKPSVWIVAISNDSHVAQGLILSYAVQPVERDEGSDNWRDFTVTWLREQQLSGRIALLVAGPSPAHPDSNYRVEFIRVEESDNRIRSLGTYAQAAESSL
jgi:pyruvate kinase